ncbi:MAG: hypothetical protein ACRERS_03100 [Methylococcales bacterium]
MLEAAKAYKLALQNDPTILESHQGLGLVYFRLHRLDEAIAENLAVINQSPNDLASLRNLALLYHQKGELSQSLIHARRALELTVNDNDRKALQAFIEQRLAGIGKHNPDEPH